eukprot:1161481-Pelagomonas_calceolata.AAC.8
MSVCPRACLFVYRHLTHAAVVCFHIFTCALHMCAVLHYPLTLSDPKVAAMAAAVAAIVACFPFFTCALHMRAVLHQPLTGNDPKVAAMAAQIAAGVYYPPTVNDPKVAAMAAAVAAEVLGGEEHVVEAVPSMAVHWKLGWPYFGGSYCVEATLCVPVEV